MRKATVAAAVFLLIFASSLTRMTFVNDHFDRIARGRQIAVYGEHPFADFRDPGHFLTLYVSAAAQTLSGGGLLGDAVVVNVAIAAAACLTFWLAASASGSLVIGLFAVLLAWLEPARYYDFDKVFFYTAGLALCWKYVDVPGGRTAAALGAVAALAALFRYDNGVFVGVAVAVTMLAHQARQPRQLATHLLAAGAAALVILVPALVFVQATAGLPEAVRQIRQYGGGEAQLLGLPPLSFDRPSIIYIFIAAVALLAPARLLIDHVRGRPAPLAHAGPKIAGAAALVIALVCLLLRDPIGARLGAVLPPALILAAFMLARSRSGRTAAGARSTKRPVAVWIAAAAAVVVVALAVSQGQRLLRAPSALARRATAMQSALLHPKAGGLFVTNEPEKAALIDYLDACTAPDARVLLTWFGPDVLYLSGRGAAGGMIVFSADHWSSDEDQRRTVELMKRQKVPIVVMEDAMEEFASPFALIAAYLEERYRPAGRVRGPGGAETGYDVLIDRELASAPVAAPWGLPCPL